MRAVAYYIALALAVVLYGCGSPPHLEDKEARKVFQPCRNGGRSPHPIRPIEFFDSNEASAAITMPLDKCVSVGVSSVDGRPTVLTAVLRCNAGAGPWYAVYQIANPDVTTIWATEPGTCPFVRFDVESHVAGTIAWAPYVGDQWERTDWQGWKWEMP